MSLSGLRAAYFQGSLSSCVGALGLCFKICGTAPLLVGEDEVYVSVREQVCVCARVYLCTCAFVCVCVSVCICCMYVCKHMHVRAHVYGCACVHMCVACMRVVHSTCVL